MALQQELVSTPYTPEGTPLTPLTLDPLFAVQVQDALLQLVQQLHVQAHAIGKAKGGTQGCW